MDNVADVGPKGGGQDARRNHRDDGWQKFARSRRADGRPNPESVVLESKTDAGPVLFPAKKPLQYLAGFFDTLPVQCRKQLHRRSITEFFSDLQQCRRRLAPFELVGLGQQHVDWQRNGAGKCNHLAIEILQLAPDVNDQYQPIEAVPGLEIFLQQLPPVASHGCRHLGEAVARQIHQALAIAQIKEVHELGSARRLAGSGELPTVNNNVDGTGFAGIGAPGDGHLRAAIGQELGSCICARYEPGIWEL